MLLCGKIERAGLRTHHMCRGDLRRRKETQLKSETHTHTTVINHDGPQSSVTRCPRGPPKIHFYLPFPRFSVSYLWVYFLLSFWVCLIADSACFISTAQMCSAVSTFTSDPVFITLTNQQLLVLENDLYIAVINDFEFVLLRSIWSN